MIGKTSGPLPPGRGNKPNGPTGFSARPAELTSQHLLETLGEHLGNNGYSVRTLGNNELQKYKLPGIAHILIEAGDFSR